MKNVLDLGGGHNSYVPNKNEKVDVIDYFATDSKYIKHNLEYTPYPLRKEYYDKIYASHILEHLENYFEVMDELHRILKKDGILIIRVPHANYSFNWTHPTHKRLFTSASMSFFEKGSIERYTKNYFNILKIELKLNRGYIFGKLVTKISNINKFTRRFFESHIGIRYDEVLFILRK